MKLEVVLFFIGFAVVAGLIIRDIIRKKKRRESLRQEPDGVWVSIEFDGSEGRSRIHPDEPGGAWASEGGGDGGGGDWR